VVRAGSPLRVARNGIRVFEAASLAIGFMNGGALVSEEANCLAEEVMCGPCAAPATIERLARALCRGSGGMSHFPPEMEAGRVRYVAARIHAVLRNRQQARLSWRPW